MTLRAKLEALDTRKWTKKNWEDGRVRVLKTEQINALIDVALAASFIDTNGDDGSSILSAALSRLEKVLS